MVCVDPFGNALDRRLLDAEITVRRLRFARLVIDLCQIGSLELAYFYSSCPTAATQAGRENDLTTRNECIADRAAVARAVVNVVS